MRGVHIVQMQLWSMQVSHGKFALLLKCSPAWFPSTSHAKGSKIMFGTAREGKLVSSPHSSFVS